MIEVLTGRDSQKRYLSALRAAKDYGQRPTAMLFHDPYALHREWWHEWLWGEPWEPDETSRDWTEWDYILADVFQVIQDITDSESGQLMHYDQSPDVYWNVKLRHSGYLEAVENYRKKNPELPPGVSPYAEPEFRDPDNKPTVAGWLRDLEEGVADRRPAEHRDARPPTPEELAALRKKFAEGQTGAST